jgi:hypothetical protein
VGLSALRTGHALEPARVLPACSILRYRVPCSKSKKLSACSQSNALCRLKQRKFDTPVPVIRASLRRGQFHSRLRNCVIARPFIRLREEMFAMFRAALRGRSSYAEAVISLCTTWRFPAQKHSLNKSQEYSQKRSQPASVVQSSEFLATHAEARVRFPAYPLFPEGNSGYCLSTCNCRHRPDFVSW